jgi:hypothetical protein
MPESERRRRARRRGNVKRRLEKEKSRCDEMPEREKREIMRRQRRNKQSRVLEGQMSSKCELS